MLLRLSKTIGHREPVRTLVWRSPEFLENLRFQSRKDCFYGEIPTPVCTLARNDHFTDTLKGAPLGRSFFLDKRGLMR